MGLVADRKGKITQEVSLQDRFLGELYGHAAGRALLKLLVIPAVSRLGGRILDSGLSRVFISGFIRRHGIDMTEYRPKKYCSYNDFFTRRMEPKARRVEMAPDVLVSPCDGRLSVYELNEKASFSIKHTRYTAESLLQDKKLAASYAGGYVWIFRLCVEDYHRYIYADGGSVAKLVWIPGVLHTVNPVANDEYPIYKENTREYCILHSDNFGEMIQMEVGALLVGKIRNHNRGINVKRGWEKGKFAFGGSTIVLITKKGEVCPDRDILENSGRGIETKVRLGEGVGRQEQGV
ncbi:MAG: phosphatidylserine decarboxylase [Lachnospiraceae bacterium]|nr:phosphatidylserine decarboxylase [uncultured Acetatifactor sp.]MCI8286330.1 phosphatidylserine decarboxylase [Lachnospiraceae bacterium]